MSLIASAVKYMLVNGASHDEILNTIAEMEAETVRLCKELRPGTPERSKHAESQAKYRAKKEAERALEEITSDHNDHGDHGDLDEGDKKVSPTPPSKNTLPPCPPTGDIPPTKSTSKGSVLPDNWRESPEDREYGRKQGLTDAEMDGHVEDLRLWAGANANRQIARKADWSRTVKGWFRREAKKKRRSQSTGPPQLVNPDGSLGRYKGNILDATARLKASNVNFGPRPSGFNAGNREGGPVVPLLPGGTGERS